MIIRIPDADEAGQILAALRAMGRLSQRALVEEAENAFSQGQLSGWEIGKRHPGLPNLLRVAHALGYDLALVPRGDA